MLISENDDILYEYYSSNQGNPVAIIKEQLLKIRSLCGDKITIRSSVVTGYGEELIQNAFQVDAGIVETMAHFKAARDVYKRQCISCSSVHRKRRRNRRRK